MGIRSVREKTYQQEKQTGCSILEFWEAHISLEEARNKALESKAYECLYDFDTGMWMEGPDYFRDLLRKSES